MGDLSREDISFFSSEDIYTLRVLDEGYWGGMLNEEANKVYQALASKQDKIVNTYSSLYAKTIRTPEEEELFKKCFANLVLQATMEIWNRSDGSLIESYKKTLQEAKPDWQQTIAKEALKIVIERKGLEIPESNKIL